jgi:hypothetical protein
LWRRLVVERGWSDERYADWLGSLWIAQLVRSADPAKDQTETPSAVARLDVIADVAARE